jgi:hypothetical protein
VSPRPQASRHDPTAERFLKAAVRLIDAYLGDQPLGPESPPRLRSIRFPAALEWLRTEDVIRLTAANGADGVSRKAFFNRWPTREAFLPDALVYALVYAEDTADVADQSTQVPQALQANLFSEEAVRIADGVLDSLLRQPRSYLTLHIGPLLPQHPHLWEALVPEMRRIIGTWADGYAALLTEAGLVLRPEWTPHRAALALQAMIDGFLLRYRIQPEDYPTSRWAGAGLFADTVIAFVLGAVDAERSAATGRESLDALINR